MPDPTVAESGLANGSRSFVVATVETIKVTVTSAKMHIKYGNVQESLPLEEAHHVDVVAVEGVDPRSRPEGFEKQ